MLGPLQRSVSQAPRRHAGRRARLPRHRLGGGVGGRGRLPRVPQLRDLVAARHRECRGPIITPRALEANFTNEGGVCGTTRLLKNIGGLWLLQSCRRGWARAARRYDYAELMEAADDERQAFASLFDPDDPVVPASARHGRRDRRVLPAHRPAGAGAARPRSPARFSRASPSGTAWSSTRSRS